MHYFFRKSFKICRKLCITIRTILIPFIACTVIHMLKGNFWIKKFFRCKTITRQRRRDSIFTI
ncbi:hypothetical protein X975_15041, partial [Stegodyphus mimosarum]